MIAPLHPQGIACVLIRQFAAAVERRARPELASQPLILAHLQGASERVYAASADAAGVQPGMKLAQALVICPEAQTVPLVTSRLLDALAQLVEALKVFSDRLEVEDDFQRDVAIYLDLGRLKTRDRIQLGKQIGANCKHLHLAATVGIAEGKFTAFVAAHISNALRVIPPGAEAKFLAPLPLALLPLDVEMERQLWLLGIERLGQFASLPKGAVLAQFGKRGRLLHDLASGRDGRLLRPYIPPRRERAIRRFPSPVEDRLPVEQALAELAGEFSRRLEAGRVGVQEVLLLLHLEGGALCEQVLRLRQPVSSAASLRLVLGRALERAQIERPVVAVEIQAERLVAQQPQQLSLFEYSEQQQRQLEQVVEQLTKRFGSGSFYRSVRAESASPLPERRFRVEQIAP